MTGESNPNEDEWQLPTDCISPHMSNPDDLWYDPLQYKDPPGTFEGIEDKPGIEKY